MGYNALTCVAPLAEYRKAKLDLLKKDFRIDVTAEEEAHVYELESEIAVDRYCRKIINNHWKN